MSRIHGRTLIDVLYETGILTKGEFVRRVVIDASVDSAVTLYVERYGDDRLLEVLPAALAGVEIRRGDDPA